MQIFENKYQERSEKAGKQVNNSLNHTAELVQRCNDRLTFNNLNIAERYIQSKIHLCLDLLFTGVEMEFQQYYLFIKCLPCGSGESSGISSINDGAYGDQSFVFVDVAQGIQGEKKIVPSLVRLQSTDNISGLSAQFLYFSLRNGQFKFMNAPRKWEIDPRGSTRSVCFGESTSQQIETGTELMDYFTDLNRERFGEFRLLFESDTGMPAIRVTVERKSARVILEESVRRNVDVRDVLIGPFNL